MEAQIEPKRKCHGGYPCRNQPHHRRDEVIQTLFIKILKSALKIPDP